MEAVTRKGPALETALGFSVSYGNELKSLLALFWNAESQAGQWIAESERLSLLRVGVSQALEGH